MTTEHLPPGVLGTPPVRTRLAAVGTASSPPSQWRTAALGVSGMAASLGALSLVGLHGLPVEALTPVCLCIAGCVGGGAAKSSLEHMARAYSSTRGTS